jgi:hypothetical protein
VPSTALSAAGAAALFAYHAELAELGRVLRARCARLCWLETPELAREASALNAALRQHGMVAEAVVRREAMAAWVSHRRVRMWTVLEAACKCSPRRLALPTGTHVDGARGR